MPSMNAMEIAIFGAFFTEMNQISIIGMSALKSVKNAVDRNA